jgi:hypothetical protein
MTDAASPAVVSFLRVGKCRLQIFHKACIKFGLTVVDHTTANPFILIDDELDVLSARQVLKNSATSASSPVFIRTQWLSDSIKQNKLLAHQSYILNTNPIRSTSVACDVTSASTDLDASLERPVLKRERSVSSSASDTDDERRPTKVMPPNSIDLPTLSS